MRLQALYLSGALAVAALPLSAGAQSLPTYDPPAASAQAYTQSAEACPAGSVWEHGGYTGGGTWRAPHCASRSGTIDF